MHGEEGPRAGVELRAGICDPKIGPKGQAAALVLPRQGQGNPFPIPAYLLVSQQELQVTLSPVGVRLCPRLQLVPLVVPAAQVLHAQRQG